MLERLRNYRESCRIRKHYDRLMRGVGEAEFARALGKGILEAARQTAPGEAFIMNPLSGEAVKYPKTDAPRSPEGSESFGVN